jgi:D-alanyl-D-alanine carboxypeptidase/D-alanyl-D-alanine-endopeptidase (penicillin-binding protein 4)
VLDPLASARGLGEFTGSVTDRPPAPSCGAAPPAPRWFRQHREAPHHVCGAADAEPDGPAGHQVVAGPEPGTVILVGGGDPTLTALPAGKEGVYPDPSRLTALADAVRKAAPTPVRRVLVDTSRYRGPTMQPTGTRWTSTGGFVTPIEPLMLDGGPQGPRRSRRGTRSRTRP